MADDHELTFWDDKDFNEELGFDEFLREKAEEQRKCRIVKCYMEDWEVDAVASKNNPVAETMLLKKYGGLQFYDIDTKKNCYLSNTELVWLGHQKEMKEAGV